MSAPAPRSGGLTATQLKYLAALFMVADHVGMLLDPLAACFGPMELPRYLLRYLGRLAFPIFAYFSAQGCRRTHDYRAYLLRLGAFGAVTHAVACAATGGSSGSVMATFFLSALAIWLWEGARARGMAPLGALAVLGALVLAQLLRVDYGWMGVLTVAAVYACGEDRGRQLLVLAACLLFYYLGEGLRPSWAALLSGGDLGPLFLSFTLPHALLMAGCSLLSLPLLARYSGERGSGSRWFFYWFYPGHLAALYLLSMLLP